MNEKITFSEITQLLAKSTSTSKRMCELFLRELIATVSQALIDGEDVKIKGIGTFKVVQIKPRKGVNVNTGTTMEVGGHGKVSFTPDKALAEFINQPFAHFETVVLEDAMTDEKLAAIDKDYPSVLDGEQESESDSEPAHAPEPEPVSGSPAEPEPIDEETPPVVEPAPPVVEPAPAIEPALGRPVSRPMLVGIPIDGPTQPVPEPDPEEQTAADDYFYRPEPRNAYTPTPEQVEAASPRKRDYRWLILVAGILIGFLLSWLLMRGCSKSEAEPQEVAVPADTVVQAEEEPVVVTETITNMNVLTTMAEKHYGSQWFWVYIYEENKDKISDPNNVPLGTVVVIPPAEKYDIDVKNPQSLKKAKMQSWKLFKGK